MIRATKTSVKLGFRQDLLQIARASSEYELSSQFRIAVTYSNYSNIRRGDSIPSTVSGVITCEDDYRELEKRNLPRKRDLIHKKNSFFLLQRTFVDVEPYLTGHAVLTLPGDSHPEELENQYLKILNILRASHLRVITGHISSVSIRAIESLDMRTLKWARTDFSKEFVNRINQFSPNWSVLDWESSEAEGRLLEVAKILARLEYERLGYLGSDYLTKIRSSPSDYFQLIRVKWDSPSIEEYSEGVVGSPTLVVRDGADSRVHHIFSDGETRLSFLPITKFCKGSQQRDDVYPCKYSNRDNPFGLPLTGSSNEECHKCRNLFEYSICFRKPLCTGYEAKCGNKQFAGNICCGLFGLYVTRFGADLKVGTAMLSRVIGRLLEQGAGSALVVYPIEGIMTAYTLEKAVRDRLVENMVDLRGYGIRNAFRNAPQRERKVRDFLREWNRIDVDLLRHVWGIIRQVGISFDNLHLNLGEANHKICDFSSNYEKPPPSLTSSYLGLNRRAFGDAIDGRVVGYRGGFLFLDSGQIADLKHLQGVVVRGSIGGKSGTLS